MSSTVASTKKKVNKLQRRSAGPLPRSEGSGLTDFSQQDVSDAGSSVHSGFKIHRSRPAGKNASVRGSSNSSSINSSINSCSNSIDSSASSNNGMRVTGLNGVSGVDVPAETNAPLRKVVAPGGLGVDAGGALEMADQTRGPASDDNAGKAGVVSGVVSSESVLTGAHAGPLGRGTCQGGVERADNHQKELDDESMGEHEGKSAAGRVGALLAALPLSKLKIVIGKRNCYKVGVGTTQRHRSSQVFAPNAPTWCLPWDNKRNMFTGALLE